MKHLLSIALLLMAVLALKAQAPQPNPLPLDPSVKHGVLPNGLSYYILHNEEPKDRANFYIAQKVGSTLEAPDQLGLAHFLEHMAFNGTKTYPGKNLLNYLQSKGIRFGADINAYTSFDETVYNIDNVPTTDVQLMDSVLLALRDWSGSILLEESEIDAERGVIREEWRSRNNAQVRMYEAMLPKIFQEYQYQQMPIGKIDIIMNFKPEVLRAYYKKWYRPDQQGIIIVGDFDATVMEKKVIELFSSIPMPENAAERTYPIVRDNTDPIYFAYTDKELQNSMITVSFKSEKLPFALRNTDMGYLYTEIIPVMLSSMINERLSDYAQEADCPYAYAGVRIGNFYVAKTKDSFNIYIIPKTDPEAAYKAALAVVARACKTGFLTSEVERARDKIIASLDKAYNERNKTQNTAKAQELINNFIDNKPALGIENERQIASMFLTNIPVEAYNGVASQLMTPNNEVIVASAPDGQMILSETASISLLNEAMNAEYEPFQEEVITDPLISSLPSPGKIISETEDSELNTTVFTLSNGTKVVLKSTDFEPDNITIQMIEQGGKRSFPLSQAANVVLCEDAYNCAKIGPFDMKMLKKYLAGKKVNLTFEIGNFTNLFNGTSTVKDFTTLMELLYASCTSLGEDKASYDAQISQARAFMMNYSQDPDFIFQQHIDMLKYNNNPMMMQPTVELIDQADYSTMIGMIMDITSNAADFTLMIVGNISKETLRPLLEQYIATLPSTGSKSQVKNVEDLAIVPGIHNDIYNQTMMTPAVNVYDCYSGTNLKYNTDNVVMVDFIGDILDMNFVETLREEEGGTYGAQTYSGYQPNTNQWQILYTFKTNHEQQEALRTRANKELMDLLKKGANPVHFNKVKEAALKQLDIKERTNKYWMNKLLLKELGFSTYVSERPSIEKLTLKQLNSFMKKLYNGKNRIEVVMLGGPDK